MVLDLFNEIQSNHSGTYAVADPALRITSGDISYEIFFKTVEDLSRVQSEHICAKLLTIPELPAGHFS